MGGSYKAVIFDLDGTLMDTLDDLHLSANHALNHFGLPERSRDEVCSFVGNGVRKLMERAVPTDFPKERLDEVLSVFRTYYAAHCRDHSAPYEGIQALLQALKKEGVKMAIVSNKPDKEVKQLNEEFFSDCISVAVGENERELGIPKKPSPEMIHVAMIQLNCQPSETLYVGDSDVDIQTAANAGVACASVTWGFRSEQFLLSHGASLLLHHPKDLLTCL